MNSVETYVFRVNLVKQQGALYLYFTHLFQTMQNVFFVQKDRDISFELIIK